jgi:hypothetical protein
MNTDRCYHIPTSEGQSMCTCQDHRMFLEMLIQMQAEYITYLERRFQKGEVRLIANRKENE